MLVIPKGIPSGVVQTATAIFGQWRRGEGTPRRVNYDRRVQVLDVGLRYRLLCRNGTRWELMSHEKYNKVIK